MKLGIVGTGAVGAAIALSVCLRGHACELVLLDRTRARADGVASDMRYGVPLSPLVDVKAGDYEALEGANVVMITAGLNEKAGGATDRNDPLGRLRLLDANAKIYEDIIPKVVAVAPEAVILVITDPPDPLADIARELARHDRVVSSGTYLDTLRFRVHLAERFQISPASVDAQVIGEHGTLSAFLWSTATVGGVRVVDRIGGMGSSFADFRRSIEDEVRFANITIIEGIGASQYGIGMVSARIAEVIGRDEGAVIPVGSFQPQYGVTLSVPSVVDASGVREVYWPHLSDEERERIEQSAARLKTLVKR
jgi:L-lactate dehydrogenase